MKALFPVSFLRTNLPVILAGLLLVFFASSCATIAQPSESNNPPSGETAAVQATPTNTTQPDSSLPPTSTNTPPASDASAPPTPDVSDSLPLPHYTITATLNYAGHLLQVDERIDYVNSSADTLTELVMMVDTIYFPGVFSLISLAWIDSEALPVYTWENAILRLSLPLPLAPGEQVSLRLGYTLNLPSPVPSQQVRPIPFGYTARQTNLVDWYPLIAPYQSGVGWLAHPAGFFGEHQVYAVADFDIAIRLEDARPDLIVAASVPAQEIDGWRHYQMQKARNFVFSVSPHYIVESTQVGQVTVTSYTFSVHASTGKTVLKTTADALALYSELFSPYPRTSLSVVEADFLDGMEYDGLYFLSNGFYNLYQGAPGEYLVAIAVHETAHMWWYALVGNDQALEPWLDEALCTYSELLFYERYYPEAIDWWWSYRIHYYEPRGWVDGSIYNPAGYRAYRDAVYLNGAVFLHELRQAIGPDVFIHFLQAYNNRYAYRIASASNFFEILSEHSNTDLTTLLSAYFSALR